jgi:hypothetical protein
MKKIISLLVFLIAISFSTLSAEGGVAKDGYLELKAGGMLPMAVPGGFVAGASMGGYIDELLSLNFAVDYFNVTPSLSSSSGTNAWVSTTTVSNINYINQFFVSFNFRFDFPVKLFQIITPYLQAGPVFNLMINTYKSTGSKELTYGFIGLGGLFEIGARIKMGNVASFLTAISFNAADVSRPSTGSVSGVVDSVIGSGFMFRVGLGFALPPAKK